MVRTLIALQPGLCVRKHTEDDKGLLLARPARHV